MCSGRYDRKHRLSTGKGIEVRSENLSGVYGDLKLDLSPRQPVGPHLSPGTAGLLKPFSTAHQCDTFQALTSLLSNYLLYSLYYFHTDRYSTTEI